MTENEISYRIRGAVLKVYKTLGAGLFESVYESALYHELIKSNLKVERQVPISITYDDIVLDVAFRIDLLIEDKVIIELKSIENFAPIHYKQILHI